MTSLERVQKTLLFEEPDRVPYFEQGMASNVASDILGREAHVGGGKLRRDGVEAAMAGPDAVVEYEDRLLTDFFDLVEAVDFDVVSLPWTGGGEPTKKLDENTYLFGNEDAFEGRTVRDGEDASWSVERFDPVSDTFHTFDSSLRGPGGLDEVRTRIDAVEARHSDRVKPTPDSFPMLQRAVERFAGQRAVISGSLLVIPIEPAWLEAMLVMPDRVERHVEMQADVACDETDVMAEMGLVLNWGGGDFCTNHGPVYSPAHFRQFMLGPLQRLTERCHGHGMPYVFRTDGVIWPVAQELFVESGVDGYGEIDKQAGMDLAEIRERLPHLILWGNVDCGRTLTWGTPGDVAAETRACIDAAAPGGGYLLGSSNVIHSGVPTDNFLAMIDTCREYGKY